MSGSRAATNRRILLIEPGAALHEQLHRILAADSAATSPGRLGYELDVATAAIPGVDLAQQAAADSRPYAVAFVNACAGAADDMRTVASLWRVDPNVQVVLCIDAECAADQIIAALGGPDDRLLLLKEPFEAAEVAQFACTLSTKWDLARRAALRRVDLRRIVEQHTGDLRESNRRLSAEIDRRAAAEARLEHQAMHDLLTGLPNRMLLVDRIGRCLERAKRQADYEIAVLQMDLDGFTVVNNSLGHDIGNALLVAAAERLGACLRAVDTMARLGADEFVILLDDVGSIEGATVVARRIEQEMARPFEVGDQEVVTTVSIGIVTSGGDYTEADDLLRDADTALHLAKGQGKARSVVFDTDMRVRVVERLEAENDLRKALADGDLFLAYQPIVRLDDGAIQGFEALARWRHPRRGMIPPDQFIPLAEETGLIIPLGQWVLKEACHQLQQWRSRFARLPQLSVSVNLSSVQFSDPDLLEWIDDCLRDTGLDPRHLNLEITESAILSKAEATTTFLAELKKRGLDLHLDDFGTGYSSLSHLHELPIDVLKVDRSFVQKMAGGGRHAATVEAVITLAHSQGLHVIAEGVETPEQRAKLQSLHCDLAQGYLFARPMEVADVDVLLASDCHWRASA